MQQYYAQHKSVINPRVTIYNRTRRQLHKEKAIQLLGGKCVRCGYNKCNRALEFHHIDGQQKERNISKLLYSWTRLVKELKKCTLLCSNCHEEVHWEEECIRNQVVKGARL